MMGSSFKLDEQEEINRQKIIQSQKLLRQENRKQKDIESEQKFKNKQRRRSKRRNIIQGIKDDIIRRVDVVKGRKLPREWGGTNWRPSYAGCRNPGGKKGCIGFLTRQLGNAQNRHAKLLPDLSRQGTPRIWRRLVPVPLPKGFLQFGMGNR